MTPFPSQVSMSCTVSQLCQEAEARGFIVGTMPLTKYMLVEMLGNGSKCIKAAQMVATARRSNTRNRTTNTTSINFQGYTTCWGSSPQQVAKATKSATTPTKSHIPVATSGHRPNQVAEPTKVETSNSNGRWSGEIYEATWLDLTAGTTHSYSSIQTQVDPSRKGAAISKRILCVPSSGTLKAAKSSKMPLKKPKSTLPSISQATLAAKKLTKKHNGNVVYIGSSMSSFCIATKMPLPLQPLSQNHVNTFLTGAIPPWKPSTDHPPASKCGATGVVKSAEPQSHNRHGPPAALTLSQAKPDAARYVKRETGTGTHTFYIV